MLLAELSWRVWRSSVWDCEFFEAISVDQIAFDNHAQLDHSRTLKA